MQVILKGILIVEGIDTAIRVNLEKETVIVSYSDFGHPPHNVELYPTLKEWLGNKSLHERIKDYTDRGALVTFSFD